MEQLKNVQNWCVWKYEQREGKLTKVPYQDRYNRAKCNDKSTWLTYRTASEIAANPSNEIDGIGLFFSDIPDNGLALCGIDIDAHHFEEGSPNPNAQAILSRFENTYAEFSPSGKGYHILCYVVKDKMPLTINGKWDKRHYFEKNNSVELEIYVGGITNRFFTYTENQISEKSIITDQTENVLWFLEEYMKKRATDLHSNLAPNDLAPIPLDDEIIAQRINIARRSKHGKEFSDLYDKGDISSQENDASKADWVLCYMLRFWLGTDENTILKAMMSSALRRQKWEERDDYLTNTIRNCLDYYEGRPVYSPPVPNSTAINQWSTQLGIVNAILPNQADVPDTSAQGTEITPHAVLKLINEAEDDVTNRDRISVLPLMCGTGKSSALRLKMRQIIEANDGYGMIIVTDNIDRMRDYLQPRDEELLRFFQDYEDRITVMTHDTLDEDLRHQAEGPILIMSTQRFIALTHSQIDYYLQWNGGQRDLIVVDERPSFKKEIDIDIESLNQIYSAIDMGMPQGGNVEKDRKEMLEFWDSVRFYLRRTMGEYVKMCSQIGIGQYYFYVRTNWNDNDLFYHVFQLMQKYRNYLNQYRRSGEYIGIYTMAQAVHQLLKDGALLGIRIMNAHVSSATFDESIDPINPPTSTVVKAYFSVMQDNYSKYADADAKVIILDGTADLSTEYTLYRDLDMRMAQCEPYKRSLQNLNIEIVPLTTGKNTLTRTTRGAREAVQKVYSYLEEKIPKDIEFDPDKVDFKPVVFSYKDMLNAFMQYYDAQHFDWFGNIKGKNDYRKALYVAQVGLNRFPMSSYFLYELAHAPGLSDSLPILASNIPDCYEVTPCQ